LQAYENPAVGAMGAMGATGNMDEYWLRVALLQLRFFGVGDRLCQRCERGRREGSNPREHEAGQSKVSTPVYSVSFMASEKEILSISQVTALPVLPACQQARSVSSNTEGFETIIPNHTQQRPSMQTEPGSKV